MNLPQGRELSRFTISVPKETLVAAERLYDQGLYLQASELLKEWGNPRRWGGVSSRILGARLAENLGASRLASYLFASSFREAPDSPDTRLYRAYQYLSMRGPWAAWKLLRDFETSTHSGTPASVHASIHALRGRICAYFKDKRGAFEFLQKAHELEPDNPWIWTEQSSIQEALDDREAALQAGQRALYLQPWYRPAVQQTAGLLLAANRDDEAEELLRCASQQIECGPVILQWIVALNEREKFAAIPSLCDKAEALLPWAEKPILEWLNARRADAYYGLGEMTRAAECAEACTGEFHQFVANRLRTPEDGIRRARVKLPVPFVRQDNDTCAPASLASLAAFWNWDVTHDQIAEAVCYGGTQMHGLRRWVEERDWIVQEFQMTWENCQQLIDRGIPFLLTTVEVGSGHMQVVEGYDALWKTILIRDPNFRHHRQVPADQFIARYEAFGPRGMVVLPPAERQRLEGLELNAKRGFDCFYQFNLALERNDRAKASEALKAMATEPPFLVYGARLALADYDANELERLRCLEEMEKEGLTHPLLTAMRIDSGRNFSDPADRLKLLRNAARWQAGEKNPIWDPSFVLTLAMELAQDEKNFPEVRRLFQRYHAMMPGGAAALSFWGRQLLMRQQYGEALELLKFATTSADKVDQYAFDYFYAAKMNGREEEALETLRQRVLSYAAKASQPAQVLYSVLRNLHDDQYAFEVLAQAMQVRPEDGGLLLFAAYEQAVSGRREEGHRLLEAAKGHSKPSLWMRTAASLAALDGAIEQETAYWAEITRLEPLSLDAHAQCARLIAAKEGPTAAVHYCQAKRDAFPFHLGFAEHLAVAAMELGDAFAEPYIRSWVKLDPYSISAHVELVRVALSQGRAGEAFFEAREKCSTNPHSTHAWYWLGKVHEEAGHTMEAKEAYKTAIRLSIDNDQAIRHLAGLAADERQQQGVLEYVQTELETQLFLEAGLYAWFDLAINSISSEEMTDKLHGLRTRRSNCWPVWNCSIRHLLRDNRIAEALQMAEETKDRFGLLSPAWLDLALIQERTGRLDDAADSIQRAIDLNPFSSEGWARLSMIREAQGRRSDGSAVLKEAIRRNPSNAVIQAILAGVLWRDNRRDEALAEMNAALRRSPGLQWAWEQYAAWNAILARPEHLVEFTGELAASRPADAVVQIAYARALKGAHLIEKAEEVLRQLLQLRPRLLEAHLLMTELLAAQSRYEEAMAICTAKLWQDFPPIALGGQAAAIEATQGRFSQAIELMQKVVERDPTYIWGLERLSEWLIKEGKYAGARRAAKRAAELQPHNGQAWQNWANIEDEIGNKEKATKLLREAIVRDPSYTAGVLILVKRLIIMSSGLAGAEEAQQILATASAAMPPPMAQTAQILIHLKRKEKNEASRLIKDLCFMEGVSVELVAFLRQCSIELKAEKLPRKALSAIIRKPGIQSAAAIWWTEENLLARRYRLASSLAVIPVENDARKEAITHYLRQLGSMSNLRNRSNATDFVKKYAHLVNEDDLLWGLVGECLMAYKTRAAVLWMRSWREHPNAKPWALRAAAIIALSNRELDEALKISQEALAMEEQDYSLPFHRLLAVLKLALDDRREEMERALVPLDATSLDTWEQNLSHIVRAIVELQQTSPDQAPEVWKNSLARLRGLGITNHGMLNRLLMDLIRRLGKRGVSYSRLSFYSLNSSNFFYSFSLSAWQSLVFLRPKVGTFFLIIMAISAVGTLIPKPGQERPFPKPVATPPKAPEVQKAPESVENPVTPIQREKYEKAFPILQQARKENPDSFETTAKLADAYAGLGRNEESLAEAKEAVRLAPENGVSHGFLGIALLHAGRTEEAIEAARTAVEYLPYNEEAWVRLEGSYQRLNALMGMEFTAKEILKSHPDSAAGWYILGCVQGMGGMKKEEYASLTKSLNLNPRSMLAWNAMGLHYVGKKQVDQAIDAFKQAIELDPTNPEPRNNLGYTYLLHNRMDDAIETLRKSVEVQPDHVRSLVNLATAYLKTGNTELAKEIHHRLAGLDPSAAREIERKL